MDETTENMNGAEEVAKKDNNPLSVRIDAAHKEIFEDIIKEKGISKKALLELMISNFVENDESKKENASINFSHDIALVTGSINEILAIFKSVTGKAQDTIESHKDYYEQQLKSLSYRLQALELRNSEIEEKNKLLEAAQTGYTLEKEKFEKLLHEYDGKFKEEEKEKNNLNLKITELLEQINILRRSERENIILKNENQELTREISRLKSIDEEKFLENESMKRKMDELKCEILELKSKKTEDIASIEYSLKKEAEIDKKTLALQLQIQYNNLQTENIKNLGIINEKSEEIKTLKMKMEKTEMELEQLKNVSNS